MPPESAPLEPPSSPRFKVLKNCARFRPGEVVDRADFRPNAPFPSDRLAERATDDAIARLTGLGCIEEVP